MLADTFDQDQSYARIIDNQLRVTVLLLADPIVRYSYVRWAPIESTHPGAK